MCKTVNLASNSGNGTTGKNRQKKETANRTTLEARELRAIRWHFKNSRLRQNQLFGPGLSERNLRQLLTPSTTAKSTSWTTLSLLAEAFGLPDVDALLTIPNRGSRRTSETPLAKFMEAVGDLVLQPLTTLAIPHHVQLEQLAEYSSEERRSNGTHLANASRKAHKCGLHELAYESSVLAAKCYIVPGRQSGSIECIDPVDAITFLTDALMAVRNVARSVRVDEVFLLAERLLDTGFRFPKWLLGRFNAEVAMLRYTEGHSDAILFGKRGEQLFAAALRENSATATPLALLSTSTYNRRSIAHFRGEMEHDYAGSCENLQRERRNLLNIGSKHGAAGALVAEAMVSTAHKRINEAQAILDTNAECLQHGAKLTQVAADCIRGFCRWKLKKAPEAEPFLIKAYKDIKNLDLWMPLGGSTLPHMLFRPDLILGRNHSEVRDAMIEPIARQWLSPNLLKRVMAKATPR